MNEVFRTIIILAGPAIKARALGASLSPAGAGMYLTGLSPGGTGEPTHYISSGWIGEDFASLIPLTTFDEDGIPTTTPGQPAILLGAAKQRAEGAGITLNVTLAQVQAILDTSDVTEQDPFVAIARLGLMLTVPKGPP